MPIRVLFIGEIIGKAGVFAVKNLLHSIRQTYKIDFVIANADGTTNGFGLGKNHSIYLHKLGIDVLTGGECIYYKKDLVSHIHKAPYMLKPANLPHGSPGRGWRFYQNDRGSLWVVSILGQSGFHRVHVNSPYHFLEDFVDRYRQECPRIIVDFHAATTAEKYSMFYLADGKVSAVIGTHFRVQTADEQILPGRTAVISDAGRTGSLLSVGGMDPETEVRKFLTQVPEWGKETWERPGLQGVIIDIADDGSATNIQRISMDCTEVPHDGDRDDNSPYAE